MDFELIILHYCEVMPLMVETIQRKENIVVLILAI